MGKDMVAESLQIACNNLLASLRAGESTKQAQEQLHQSSRWQLPKRVHGPQKETVSTVN